MSWSTRRKIFVTLVVLTFFGLIGLFFLLPVLLQEPTCFDGKKNGQEAGVDCGGSCSLLCQEQVLPLEIRFERSVEVDATTYDAVAYVINNNIDAVPELVRFKVSLFDATGSRIVEKEGTAFIRPAGGTPLYVPGIVVGERKPVRTRFEILETGPFFRYSNQQFLQDITVKSHVFDNTFETPRLTVSVENASFDAVRDLDVYALLYDSEKTLIAVGKTYIEGVAGKGTAQAYFSWRSPFSTPSTFEFVLIRKPVLR